MKSIALIAVLILSIHLVCAQKAHIKQSTPFENVLLALETDSVDLFMNAFSTDIIKGEFDLDEWASRLSSGQKKFSARFQDWKRDEFDFAFDKADSRLIIYFRGEESLRMWVVKEKRQWKLNEK
jgi:hypothetical protein